MSNQVTTAELLSHLVVTPEECARILRAGRNSTLIAIQSGAIPSFSVGRNYKIPTAWLKQQLKLGITPEAA
jgi:hypothetical protein